MNASSTRPPTGGKPSLPSDVSRRISHWLTLAAAFLVTAETCIPGSRASAGIRVLAFNIHQSVESSLNAILAALSPGERRRLREAADIAAMRSHDLWQLRSFASLVCPNVRQALPIEEADDARLFELLASAYTRSRYSEKRFHLSATDAAKLVERAKALQDVAIVCTASARGEARS